MAAVYPNLAGEIAKRGIKKCVLAKEAGISDRVLRNKMAGKGSFSIQEAIEIKNKFFPDYRGNRSAGAPGRKRRPR